MLKKNSPSKYHRECIENSTENFHSTDVEVNIGNDHKLNKLLIVKQNSPAKYHRECIENTTENFHNTDVEVNIGNDHKLNKLLIVKKKILLLSTIGNV